MNFGKTIHENLKEFLRKSDEDLMYSKILIERKKRLSLALKSLLKKGLTEEEILTFMSFQHMISSKTTTSSLNTRGNGLKNFLTHVRLIKSDLKPNEFDISIISGDVTIKFLGEYEPQGIDGSKFSDTIAFNKTGKVNDRQDKKCFERHANFPGTIINIKKRVILEE